jgi:hypothetical protein
LFVCFDTWHSLQVSSLSVIHLIVSTWKLFLGVCISELVLQFCLPFTSGQMKKTCKLQAALNKEFGAYNSRCFSRGVQKA